VKDITSRSIRKDYANDFSKLADESEYESHMNHMGSSKKRSGRWTRSEHIRFLQALKLYGRDWKAVMIYVKTRTSTQSRSHAQKFLGKIKRKGVTLLQFLDSIDFDNLEKLSACEIGYDEDLDLVLKVG